MSLKPSIVAALTAEGLTEEETLTLIGLLQNMHSSQLAKVAGFEGHIANLQIQKAEEEARAAETAATLSKLLAPEPEPEGA